MNRSLSLLIYASLIGIGPYAASAQELITKSLFEKQFEITARLIVMLKVDYKEGTPEVGAGFIFGHDKDRLFIATANHVVQKGAMLPVDIWVTLKTMPGGKPVKATLLKNGKVENLDLAVLSIENLAQQGINVCAFPYDRLGVTDELKRGDTVFPVGNPNGDSWAEPVEPDRVSQVSEKEIVFQSALISGGNSGGPLIDARASLVGMTTADQPPFGRAINMNLILSRVQKWGYPVQLSVFSLPELDIPPLHIAAMNGDTGEVKKLLASCNNPDDVDMHYVTALHLAAFWGKLEACTLLIKAGASLDAQDALGDTPLHHAVDRSGNLESIKLLMSAGAQINALNYQGLAPLNKALLADSVDYETVVYLIHSGANVNLKDLEKNTPLHYAAESGNTEIAKVLLKANADREAENKLKRTPLLLAVENQKTEMVRLLILSGANVNGRGVLLTAASHPENREIIKTVLKAGADVNEKGEDGNTPLHHAVFSGHNYRPASLNEQLEDIIMLLKGGAAVNAVNGNGNTPLSAARKLFTDPHYGSDKDKEDYLDRFKAIERVLLQYGAR
ncbi:ankyrin repeat domain-containing protein [Flavitalea flava]